MRKPLTMKSDKVRKFLQLAGQAVEDRFHVGSAEDRLLGAQLLLSEVLEYVVHGLGVIPVVDGHPILKPNDIHYESGKEEPSKEEMLDGLADIAYTMYWNQIRFGIPLEEAFELVCDNNLSKFVLLGGWSRGSGPLPRSEWSVGQGVVWPPEVCSVDVIECDGGFYAVGKDRSGKVRKPSTYQGVALTHLLTD